MWNGDHGGSEDDKPREAQLAASALAAYTTGQAVAPQAVAGHSVAAGETTFGYPGTTPTSILYQTQAMEALRLRRQEELRQQTLLAIQQEQLKQHQDLGFATHHLAAAQHLGPPELALAGVTAASLYNSPGFPHPHHAPTATPINQVHGSDHHLEDTLPATSPLQSSGRHGSRLEPEGESADCEDLDLKKKAPEDPPEDCKKPKVEMELMEKMPVAGLAAEYSTPDKTEIEAEVIEDAADATAIAAVAVAEPPKKKKAPKRAKSPASQKRKTPPPPVGPTIHDETPDITEEEYENVQEMMVQFCRVPLLAEFSRPVSLLHPELMTVYSKIVKYPIDLGRVCRGIRRREYTNTRAIQMDMWRIFANCVKYHTHPNNKDSAVPAFISIALHLREYFNSLWQEYMIPSDLTAQVLAQAKNPKSPMVHLQTGFLKRAEERLKRIASTSTTILSTRCLQKTAAAIQSFIDNGGLVDRLDSEAIFDTEDLTVGNPDFRVMIKSLTLLRKRLIEISTSDQEFTVEEFERDVKRCYDGLFVDSPPTQEAVASRLDRLIGKLLVPIYETSCRGVNQSSIWGCMAAAIWARESSKKPYWPALVLGILAPDDQKEDWHKALTERNELRLPERLRAELQTGKRKAEQALRKQNAGAAEQMSFFLVEFMGTHEFIWVKESDIIETFDPDDDPNQHVTATSGKKKRSSRNITDSKTFTTALEEGRWALEEFELQLSDTCGDLAEEEDDDGQDMNYSYAVLCQSDDEADNTEVTWQKETMSESDVEEANELLQTDGLLDYSTEGRKSARKRSNARKKERASAEKKDKQEQQRKIREAKKRSKSKESKESRRQKEADFSKDSGKRRKRVREPVSDDVRKKPRFGATPDIKSLMQATLTTKKGRASAIVRGYITRLLQTEDIKNLCFGGVMSIPASIVDSSGILGMALAFKAAAGEIPMPESAEAYCRFKPWDEIDCESPTSSTERVEKLKEQLALLEKRAISIRNATQRRRDLTEVALKKREQVEKDIFDVEKIAKQKIMGRPLKKKAKSEPKESPACKVDSTDGMERAGEVAESHQADTELVEVGEAAVVEAVSEDVPEAVEATVESSEKQDGVLATA